MAKTRNSRLLWKTLPGAAPEFVSFSSPVQILLWWSWRIEEKQEEVEEQEGREDKVWHFLKTCHSADAPGDLPTRQWSSPEGPQVLTTGLLCALYVLVLDLLSQSWPSSETCTWRGTQPLTSSKNTHLDLHSEDTSADWPKDRTEHSAVAGYRDGTKWLGLKAEEGSVFGEIWMHVPYLENRTKNQLKV